jgi:hypothetical protein
MLLMLRLLRSKPRGELLHWRLVWVLMLLIMLLLAVLRSFSRLLRWILPLLHLLLLSPHLLLQNMNGLPHVAHICF